MAITGSEATINTATADSLRGSTINSSIVGNPVNGTASYFGSSAANGDTQMAGTLAVEDVGSQLAGVTPDMAKNIASGIESYRTRIDAVLNKLNNVDPSTAFKGSAITSSLTNFVDGVKTVANNYLTRLSDAEREIVESVAAAYESQDEQLSGQMNADTKNVVGSSSTNG